MKDKITLAADTLLPTETGGIESPVFTEENSSNGDCDIVSQFSKEFTFDADKIKNLTDDAIVKRYVAAVQIGTMARESRIAFFDEMCRRFKNYAKKREGIPTLECAFADYGLNYDTERQAVYREKKRLQEDLAPLDTTWNEKKLPQLADGAEVIVKANGHPFTVEHDNLTADKVIGDEIIEGDVRVRREFKRGDLCSMAEWQKQTCKKDKKKDRIDQKAASNAILADLALDLIGLLCNAPADATPDAIIMTARQTAEYAYESLDEELAKRITIPKLVTKFVKQPTNLQAEVNELREQEVNLQEKINQLNHTVKALKEENKKLQSDLRAAPKPKRAQGNAKAATSKSFHVRRIDAADFGLFPDSAEEFTKETAVAINTDYKVLEDERDRMNKKYAPMQSRRPHNSTKACQTIGRLPVSSETGGTVSAV